MNLLLSGIVALSAFWTPPAATSPSVDKLHPYLAEQMLLANADRKLPVYFVIGDRLGYDHWFPRVNALPLAERRALVVGELREHARRTQAELRTRLEQLQAAGRVSDLQFNWVGNFVQALATPDAVLEGAALASVSEVWFDYEPPLDQVRDGGAVASRDDASSTDAGYLSRMPFMPAGNGPIDTKADQVWALGINGAGVVVMNADDGINVNHSDLAGRLWVNTAEIPGNGIDDDNNGFADDRYGWNFGSNSANLSDGGGHGTQTAGCLVADGTCNGVMYGQAPGAKVMTARLGGEASQWNAIQYAIAMGADCQTSSHSYKNNFNPPPNYAMHRDVGESSLAAGLIRTNSTSNNGTSCNSTTSLNRRPFNIAAPGNLPAPYIDPNQTLVGRKGGVLGVAAHTVNTTSLAGYSPCGPFAWKLSDVQVVLPNYNVANWDSINDEDYPWTGGSQQGLLKPDISAPTGTTTTSGSGTCGTSTFSGTSNATPVANGVLCLWKSANASLTPEDAAMVVHQSAVSTGNVAGKENNFGAGKIDARDGLDLALCVQRVNGEPAWKVTQQAGGTITLSIDTVPNATVILGVGTGRVPGFPGGGNIRLASGVVFFVGTSDASGNLSLSVVVPPGLAGTSLFTQWFSADHQITGTPAVGRLLSSNVVEIVFTP